MTPWFTTIRNGAPISGPIAPVPALNEAKGAFVRCPTVLMPMPMYWGIYQEAYRRAAEQVAAAKRPGRCRIIAFTGPVQKNTFATVRSSRS